MAEDNTRTRNWWLLGGTVVLVVAVAATTVLLVLGRDGGQDTAAPPPQETQEPAEDSQDEGGGNIPAAEIGNTQRTWPDPAGGNDDAAHAIPGEYSADLLSRPVFTPVNHDGDLTATGDLTDGMDQCSVPEDIQLEGQTQIQYVNARYLVVNEQAGPTEMHREIPAGYAHSPQGAVLAAMNQAGYGLYAQGDEIGYEADRQLWHDSKTAQEEREFFKMDETGPSQWARATMVLAPESFQIEACTDEMVIVSLAYTDGQGTYQGMRLPMEWNGKDWESDLAGSADDLLNQPNPDTDTHTLVEYS